MAQGLYEEGVVQGLQIKAAWANAHAAVVTRWLSGFASGLWHSLS